MKNIDVEEIVKNHIAGLDLQSMVHGVIKSLISDDVKRLITKTTQEQVSKMIGTEIEIVLSKGVEVDDGWGNKKRFETFENMFKQALKAAVSNNYDIKREVERYLKDRVETEVKGNIKQITEAMLNAISK